MQPASVKPIYRQCQSSVMQTAIHSCARTAHWEGACTASASSFGKAAILALTTSPTTLPKKVCVIIGPGIQKRMQQGGGEGSPAKKVKINQTNEN
jgi:hypothetical protein